MKSKTYKSTRKSFTLCSYLLFAVLFFSSTVVTKSSPSPRPHGSTAAESLPEPDSRLQELREKLNHFANGVRFQYDSTVLPTKSILALDSIMRLMNEQPEAYQYLIRVHSYEDGKSADYMLEYSKSRANAIHRYLVMQGISSKTLLVQGMGSSDLKCFDEKEPDCYHRNNRLEIDLRKWDDEEGSGELSSELTLLASRLRFSTHGALFHENDAIIKEMADYMKQSNDSYNLIVHAYDPIAPEYFNVALCETKGETLEYFLQLNDIAVERLNVIPKGNAQYQWIGKYTQFLLEIEEITNYD